MYILCFLIYLVSSFLCFCVFILNDLQNEKAPEKKSVAREKRNRPK